MFQFRLRTLLIVFLVVALLMTAWNWKLRGHRAQLRAASRLQPPPQFVQSRAARPVWLRYLSNPKEFQDVHHLSYHNQLKLKDEHMKQLQAFPKLERLSLHGTRITDEGLAQLQHVPNLNTLSLRSTRITDEGTPHLRSLTKLRLLQLGQTNITGEGLEPIRELTLLEHLELDRLKITDEHLAYLANLKKLKRLDLNQTRIQGIGIDQLAGLKQLEDLRISGRLNNVTLTDYPRLTNLRIRGRPPLKIYLEDLPELLNSPGTGEDELTMVDCPKVKSVWTSARRLRLVDMPALTALEAANRRRVEWELEGVPALTRIDVMSLQLDRDILEPVGKLPRLEYLSLGPARSRYQGSSLPATSPIDTRPLENTSNLRILDISGYTVEQGVLTHLRKHTQLEELILTAPTLESDDLEVLGKWPKLNSLVINGAPLTDAALPHIGRSPLIHYLDLSGSRLSGGNLDQLATLTNLRVLILNRIDLINETVSSISDLAPSLTQLHLDKTRLNDEGVERLIGLQPSRNLRDLHLADTLVTVDCLEALKQLPNLNHLHIGGAHFELTEEVGHRLSQFPSLVEVHVSTPKRLSGKEMRRWRQQRPIIHFRRVTNIPNAR